MSVCRQPRLASKAIHLKAARRFDIGNACPGKGRRLRTSDENRESFWSGRNERPDPARRCELSSGSFITVWLRKAAFQYDALNDDVVQSSIENAAYAFCVGFHAQMSERASARQVLVGIS